MRTPARAHLLASVTVALLSTTAHAEPSPQDLPPPRPLPTATPDAPDPAARRAFVILPKLGILITGGATIDASCSGTAPPGGNCLNKKTDVDEAGGPALGLDFLVGVTDNLRLGAGALYNTDGSYKQKGTSASLGKDLSLVAIVEGIFPVAKRVSAVLRAQGGAMLFFPGGFLSDTARRDRRICASVGATCDIQDGTKVGYTYGVGAGLVFDVGRIGLRGDLLWQGYHTRILSESVSLSGASATIDNALTGSRFWLFLGVEI